MGDATKGLEKARAFGRKLDADDVDDDIRAFAIQWMGAYQGTFEFVLSVRAKYVAEGTISDGMVKGIVNTALAAIRKSEKQVAPPRPPLADGVYLSGDRIFKVQHTKDKQRQYAKELHVLEFGKVEFEYAPGAMAKLVPGMRMTKAQALLLGAEYGTCLNCGRTLSDPHSVELSIGPVCIKKFPDWIPPAEAM